MVTFVAKATTEPHQAGVHGTALDDDLLTALRWTAERTPQQVMRVRELMVESIEKRAKAHWDSGRAARWLEGADAVTREVKKTVCGPLLAELAQETDCQDAACVETLRQGAPVLGVLPAATGTVPAESPEAGSHEELQATCGRKNAQLLESTGRQAQRLSAAASKARRAEGKNDRSSGRGRLGPGQGALSETVLPRTRDEA